MKDENFELSDHTPIFLTSDMKSKLQEVYDYYRAVKSRNEYLENENARLKSDAYKDEELAKMKEELEKMKADYYRGFPITEKETEKINEWKSAMEDKLSWSGKASIRYSYKFFPTELGTIGIVTNDFTGEKFTFRELI